MNRSHLPSEIEFPIMEQFYTIQGEGKHSGRPAYFIRFGGCDVACVWCDVKESWNENDHPRISVKNLVEMTKKSGCDFVVITGGEPAMYDITCLVDELHKIDVEVAIETSGCYALKGNVDWYCFSPKKFKKPCSEAYQKANELKVVVFHPSDLEWAESHALQVNKDCLLYLQPEWSKKEQILHKVIDYVKENPKWKISLQTHKYMEIP
jgi:7-carboxy-7-deazaguanine synthase